MVEVLENRACTVDALVHHIARARMQKDPRRSLLVALSGIDASGKGYVARELAEKLEEEGYRVAVIGVDGWLNPPHKRFDKAKSAEHFYQNALRLDEMFASLIRPLRDTRSVRLEANCADETVGAYRRHTYDFDDIDIVLLEGIFLLKWEYFPIYDLSIWVDCTYTTALDRALRTRQEGLTPDATIWAYHTTYFPAQQMHIRYDNPKCAATFVLRNDRLLESHGEDLAQERAKIFR